MSLLQITQNHRTDFFDRLSENWDHLFDMEVFRSKLLHHINRLKLKSNEIIIDVGCGTGTLTSVLLEQNNTPQKIYAIDISIAMLNKAKEKIDNPNVIWCLSEASAIPVNDQNIDRIFYLCVWPHFDNPIEVIYEALRILKRGGWIHICHFNSRFKVNEIHAAADRSVSRDVLIPAKDLAVLLTNCGFEVSEVTDNEQEYLISATKV